MTIEVLKQALEALEGVVEAHHYVGGTPVVAIQAINAEIRRLTNMRVESDDMDALKADAERYRYIRSGEVYIEPNDYPDSGKEFYAAMGEAPRGKYYADMNEFDLDLDAAIEQQKETT